MSLQQEPGSEPLQAGALSIDDKLLAGDSDAQEKAAVGIDAVRRIWHI